MTRDWYEFTEYEAPDGEIYRFDTDTKFLMSETGLGMPPIEYIAQRGPFQHGQTYYDYRLQPRIIQIVHRRNACSRTEWWANRANLLNLLRPNRQSVGEFVLGALNKILTNGDKRSIDVMIEQGPMFRARDTKRWDEWGIMETLRFVAPDPTFYDPTKVSESWVLAPDTANHLVFPFTFDGTDMVFRQYVINEDHIVTYAGTWLSYPTIVITGPMIEPKISNETTEEVIYLNYDVEDSEVITINLEYGNKSVSSSTHGNIIGAIDSISDLATFHIAPDPEAAGGANTLNVICGAATATTEVDISFYTRYIGI